MALLEAKGLSKWFTAERPAVADVSITVRSGQTVGLVGESGSGKTTTARMILGLVRPDGGAIQFDGINLLAVSGTEQRAVRARLQFVPQQPRSSLNPRLTAGASIEFNLRAHGWTRTDRRTRVVEVLDAVGLAPAFRSRYPSELSGGQIQRVAIARALATKPRLVVCDEAVSALDKSVQAQILNLLVSLQADLGVSFLFISHDLGAVEHISDEIAVMYRGRLVEQGETETLFTRPRHPYTATLLHAAPPPDPHAPWRVAGEEDADAAGEPPGASDAVEGGCAFAPRCRHCVDLCRSREPALEETGSEGGFPHVAACHRKQEIELQGL